MSFDCQSFMNHTFQCESFTGGSVTWQGQCSSMHALSINRIVMAQLDNCEIYMSSCASSIMALQFQDSDTRLAFTGVENRLDEAIQKLLKGRKKTSLV